MCVGCVYDVCLMRKCFLCRHALCVRAHVVDVRVRVRVVGVCVGVGVGVGVGWGWV